MSIQEAANRLGCTKRSVHNYINSGFVRRTVRDGKTLVQREDVEQLALDKGTDFPALSRRTIYELTSRIAKLEQQVALVQQVWGIQEKPLHPSPQEADGLYRMASSYLEATAWNGEEVELWANLFNQFDEQTLDTIGSVMKDNQPWKNFYGLVNKMLDYVSSHKETKESLQLQALRAKLEMGRRKVREATLLWIESGRGMTPTNVFKALDNPKEDLLRALAGRGKK